MTTYLHKKFDLTISKIFEQNIKTSILIAVSGGQDSLCLIKLLEDFYDKYKFLLEVAYIYIDHQWRKDSYNQIRHLINIIKSTQQKIIIYQIKDIVNSEAKARKLRYQILIKHAEKYNYLAIITAHTSTDRIETFWQQLVRGTTINGITSFHQCRRLSQYIYIYRPLIEFSRTEINWLCRKFYLSIWSDMTNYEYKMQRNRLRNELIPYINKYFTINLEKRLINFLEISNLENEYIKQNAIKLYLMSRHKISVALNYSLIAKQHISLQKRTLQIFFHHVHQSLDTVTINQLIMHIANCKVKHYTVRFKNINIHVFCNKWIYIN
uniref:tRNA(Ile)-lysidine synthase n=1 Tax=Betaphycus gelatinus TaxID=1191690 RepID=A0A8E7UEA6_9FLOR|nr:tRNA(Ile)-lysidine synthase [Betaphycus gelatinus]